LVKPFIATTLELLNNALSAVTVSIFGFAVGFYKNRGSGSFSIGPDFNHVQSRERAIIGSVSYHVSQPILGVSYRIVSASIVSGKTHNTCISADSAADK